MFSDRYQDRVKEGGWKQELFVSSYRIAEASEKVMKGDDMVQEAFMRAHLTIPTRSEAVYRVMLIFIRQQKFRSAYEHALIAMNNVYSVDHLFAIRDIYEYGMRLCAMECAFNHSMLHKENLFQNVVTLGMDFLRSPHLTSQSTVTPQTREQFRTLVDKSMRESTRIKNTLSLAQTKRPSLSEEKPYEKSPPLQTSELITVHKIEVDSQNHRTISSVPVSKSNHELKKDEKESKVQIHNFTIDKNKSVLHVSRNHTDTHDGTNKQQPPSQNHIETKTTPPPVEPPNNGHAKLDSSRQKQRQSLARSLRSKFANRTHRPVVRKGTDLLFM